MKTLLLILVSFVSLTAIISGLIFIYDPSGSIFNLSTNLLMETPFKDFLIPGILLTIFVGGVNLLAVFYSMQHRLNRYNWALAGGAILVGWIVVQMILIQTVNQIHFIYLGIGLLIMLLAYQLKGKWVV